MGKEAIAGNRQQGTKPYRVGKIRRIDGKQNRTEAAAVWNSNRPVQYVRGILTNFGDRATPPPRSPISSSLSLRNKPYPGILKQSEETAGVSHVSVTPKKSKAKSSTTEHSSSKPVFIERTLTCANRVSVHRYRPSFPAA
ncbi:hypothetical protein J6590_095770 [Homalodisca vitripennis]|nr:hypothetical protein J6590_095770 [Homalodisca vitripennis]